MASSKLPFEVFFKKLVDKQNTYECLLCKKKCIQNTDKGYTNLMAHLKGVHKDYESRMKSDSLGSTLGPRIDNRVENMGGWLDWVVSDGLPFNFIEKPTTRKYCRSFSTS